MACYPDAGRRRNRDYRGQVYRTARRPGRARPPALGGGRSAGFGTRRDRGRRGGDGDVGPHHPQRLEGTRRPRGVGFQSSAEDRRGPQTPRGHPAGTLRRLEPSDRADDAGFADGSAALDDQEHAPLGRRIAGAPLPGQLRRGASSQKPVRSWNWGTRIARRRDSSASRISSRSPTCNSAGSWTRC